MHRAHPKGNLFKLRLGCPARNCSRRFQDVDRQLPLSGLEADRVKLRETPPLAKKLNGEQEAQVIALRLGSPPPGFANGALRLLAQRVVAWEIVPAISHETVRRTLKKTG